jgi:hypothetical protein
MTHFRLTTFGLVNAEVDLFLKDFCIARPWMDAFCRLRASLPCVITVVTGSLVMQEMMKFSCNLQNCRPNKIWNGIAGPLSGSESYSAEREEIDEQL